MEMVWLYITKSWFWTQHQGKMGPKVKLDGYPNKKHFVAFGDKRERSHRIDGICGHSCWEDREASNALLRTQASAPLMRKFGRWVQFFLIFLCTWKMTVTSAHMTSSSNMATMVTWPMLIQRWVQGSIKGWWGVVAWSFTTLIPLSCYKVRYGVRDGA